MLIFAAQLSYTFAPVNAYAEQLYGPSFNADLMVLHYRASFSARRSSGICFCFLSIVPFSCALFVCIELSESQRILSFRLTTSCRFYSALHARSHIDYVFI